MDFDTYLAEEDEPTLRGLLRFGAPSFDTRSVPLAMQGKRSDPDEERTSHVEWYTPGEFFEAMGVEFDLDPCSPGAKKAPWIPARRHLTAKPAAEWGDVLHVDCHFALDFALLICTRVHRTPQ